ncbi:MAG: tyrosine-type recombinase/integrase [Phycisphaerales bacterium]
MTPRNAPVRLVREDGPLEPMRFRFTVRLLNQIAPADKQVWVYDTHTPGLTMLTTPNGARTFYLARRIQGRYRRVKLGSFPGITIEQARKLAAKTTGEIADGQNPAEERRQARDATTFGGLFDYYMTAHAKVHKRGWKRDQRAYELHLKRWAGRRLDSIKRADVAALHARIGKEHPIGANRVLALISKVFNVASAIGFEGANPARGVKRFAENQKDRYITAEEMPAFLRELDKEKDDVRDILYTLLLTGLRRSNCLQMEWAWVDTTRRTLVIPRAAFKGKRDFELPIVPAVMDILERRKADDPHPRYVFPNRRKNPKVEHAREPGGALDRVCERAGIAKVTPHDLRRTIASWATERGTPYPVTCGMLGHRPMGVTAVYARYDRQSVRDAFEQTAEAILATKCASLRNSKPTKTG